MAVLDPPQGYELEFLDSVPDELLCKKCTLVARRLVITGCCGESFCQTCIADTNTPCPACGSNEVSSFEHVKNQRLISNLRVYCSMKERGCVWSGPLDQLDTHLDPDLDNCQYVDTKCPLNCLQDIPKNEVEQLAVKTELKLEEQDKILQTLDDKFQEQNERLQKQDEKHSEEEDLLKKKIEEQERELVKLDGRMKDQRKISESYSDKLKLLEEKLDKAMDQSKLHEKITSQCAGHVQLERRFFIENFSKEKNKNEAHKWKSPTMYTHAGGYKLCLGVDVSNEFEGLLCTVYIWSIPGEFDDELKWPVSAEFTVEAINQRFAYFRNHYLQQKKNVEGTSVRITWDKQRQPTRIGQTLALQLYSNNSDKEKNNYSEFITSDDVLYLVVSNIEIF